MESKTEYDIAIVGAGLAGVSCAKVLSTKAFGRVALIDPRLEFPACFKAEKIEPDQAELFRSLGLFDLIKPVLAPIHKVELVWHGRRISSRALEQYGVPYHQLVNTLAQGLSAHVDRILARVIAIYPKSKNSEVQLSNGMRINARLIILATGTHEGLADSLGLIRMSMSEGYYSMAFGFSIKPVKGASFQFDSLTCFPSSFPSEFAFLTLFPFQNCMRANLFTYHQPESPWVRQLFREPVQKLTQAFDGLFDVTEAFELLDTVHANPISLYKIEPPKIPGVVCISDSCQSVCPATGTGLSKVLTDVTVLCSDFVPHWLNQSTIDEEHVSKFYEAPKKLLADQHSLSLASYQKRFATDPTLKWRLHRKKVFFQIKIEGNKLTNKVQQAHTYPFSP